MPKVDEDRAPWHRRRESVFVAMRNLLERNTYNHHKATELYPKYGTIGVGSSDFDYLLKAIVGDAYLRAIRLGKTPDEALREAKQEGNDCVKKWNTQGCKSRITIVGRYELHRWDKVGESEAESIHNHFLAMAGLIPEYVPPPPPPKPVLPDQLSLWD